MEPADESKTPKEDDKILPSFSGSSDKFLSDSESDSDSELSCELCDKRFTSYKTFLQHQKSRKHAKAVKKKKQAKKILDKVTTAEELSDEDLFPLQEPYAECNFCKKEFGSPESYYSHLVSKGHKQKIRQASILDQAKDDGQINLDKLKQLLKIGEVSQLEDDEESTQGLECKDCNKSFSGIIPYTTHLTSKVHTKTVEKNKLLEKLVPRGEEYSEAVGHKKMNFLAVEDEVLVCRLCTTSFSGPDNARMHMKSRGHAKNLEKYERKQKKKAAEGSHRGNDSEGESGSSSGESAGGEKLSDSPVRDNKRKSWEELMKIVRDEPDSNETKQEMSDKTDASDKGSEKDKERKCSSSGVDQHTTPSCTTGVMSNCEAPNEDAKESKKLAEEEAAAVLLQNIKKC